MMRLRRTSVIATFSLLTWTATPARCAWVLWEQINTQPLVSESVRGHGIRVNAPLRAESEKRWRAIRAPKTAR